MNRSTTNPKTLRLFLFAGILLLAFNLRPAITSVGPILGIIREDLAISHWSAGLLTSLPLIAFAAVSPIAPRIANRMGTERGLMAGLLVLFLGILIRSIAWIPMLYTGMFMIGSGIAMLNVLLPSLIKQFYPDKAGPMTGIYTTSMSLFAAMGSGFSVPLAQQTGFGWQWSLLAWGILTLLGIAVWGFVLKQRPGNDAPVVYEPSGIRMLKSAVAWQVTIYMGLQSLIFYVTVSWLADILVYNGFTSASAGWYVAYMQFVSLPANFFTAVIAGRMRNQGLLVMGFGLSGLTGFVILLGSPGVLGTTVAVTFIGVMTGASISLALTLLVLRSTTPGESAELSGMAQSIGYFLAAMGPLSIGLLFDVTGSWEEPIVTVIVLTLIMMGFGLLASRDRTVFQH